MGSLSRFLPTLLPLLLVVIAMISIQGSASLAKSLFSVMSPAGVTALRLGFSAFILLLVFKPWQKKVPVGAWRPILIYGLALGGMNLAFYSAIRTIPLGIAVALEFTGPLALSILASRRVIDFAWAGLAVAGVCLLLPLGEFSPAIDPTGAAFALVSGVCWALYMVFGKKAGMLHGATSVSLSILIAAVLILPLGLYAEGSHLFSPEILPTGFVIGLFSSALPYGLEIFALAKLPSQTFGILMSLEPALAALSGLLFLHENLDVTHWIALACVMAASVGATLTAKRS